MQTFLEISANFYNDWTWYDAAPVPLAWLGSQMPILVTALAIHYFTSSSQKTILT